MRALLLALLVFATSPGLRAAETALSGTWKGPWYLGMSSGPAELVLDAEGGTLMLANHETFGSERVPLTGVVEAAGVLRFRALGADGRWLEARLPLDSNRQTMKGMVKHGTVKLLLELRRVP